MSAANKIKLYAKLLTDINPSPAKFKLFLKKRKDLRLAGRIFEEAARIMKEEIGRKAELFTASPADANFKKYNFFVQKKVLPALLGGATLIIENKFIIDETFLAKLRRLWFFFKQYENKSFF